MCPHHRPSLASLLPSHSCWFHPRMLPSPTFSSLSSRRPRCTASLAARAAMSAGGAMRMVTEERSGAAAARHTRIAGKAASVCGGGGLRGGIEEGVGAGGNGAEEREALDAVATVL
ncbi:hypothetical protein B0H14DRAFT_2656370 [Mycena olivaceomarginata]|nr:hypothetical protein B0H14DRAFT_2656370 [Mycena olivaceomarginata]